jgi:HlyD family secretion protein
MSRHRSAVAAAVALAATLAGCSGGGNAQLQGYIEGTYVYVAAESGGRLTERPASAGERIAEGALLFALDDSDQKQAVAGAEARLAQANAQLANLRTGKRPEEVAVLEAQLAQARSNFENLDEDYRRKLQLQGNGIVAKSVVDAAKNARDSAQAQVEAAQAQVDAAKLPARPDEIEGAERNVAAQEAALEQAKIQLDRRQVKAPASGLVDETFYEVGELVNAGQAVVSLLPDANRKVRFYVPEARLSEAAIGREIGIACDGCAAGMTATIAFVATAAEFTPPIIYSKDSRAKLVYRVEARPLGETASLNVGQPVDVKLGAAAAP